MGGVKIPVRDPSGEILWTLGHSAQVPELRGTWRAEDGSRGTFQGLKAEPVDAAVKEQRPLSLAYRYIHRHLDIIVDIDTDTDLDMNIEAYITIDMDVDMDDYNRGSCCTCFWC